MHCSFRFLNVSNGPTSILPNISVTLRKSHKTILWGIFEKSQIPARDVFETSQRCHGKDIFFEICLRRLKDVIQNTSFLRCIWDVLKTSQKSCLFWDVSERSLRCLFQWKSDSDLSETSQLGWDYVFNLSWLCNVWYILDIRKHRKISRKIYFMVID